MKPRFALLAAALPLLMCVDAAAQSAPAWPRWRGPTGQGIAAGAKLTDHWPAELKPLWTASLGSGWSSPVVAGDRVFATDRQDGSERVLAFDDKTGEQLWTHGDPVDF
ncbi:MAG: hypothetical protein B7Z73_02070, partial [Planctomycetia bacterium 21-64-5]